MKKIICLLLALLMIFSLAACGGNGTQGDTKPPKDDDKPTQSTPPSTEDDNKTTEPSHTKPEDMLLRVYGKIYVKYPSDWEVESDTQSLYVLQGKECLVNVLYRNVSMFEGELEDIVPFLSRTFADAASKYCTGSIYGGEIVTTSMERSTVAGYDCVKFEGTIENGDWDCHVYGYGLIVEDRVIMITGLVSAKDQDADMIAEIDALTDRIAASIEVKK